MSTTPPVDFNMSCPCDGRLASVVEDVVRQAAKDAGRDAAEVDALTSSVGEFLRACFAKGAAQPPILVHVDKESVSLQANGRTLSLPL
jgi:hypothetical protein